MKLVLKMKKENPSFLSTSTIQLMLLPKPISISTVGNQTYLANILSSSH